MKLLPREVVESMIKCGSKKVPKQDDPKKYKQPSVVMQSE